MTTLNQTTPATKPTYTPQPYEIQHGNIKDGVFQQPYFELYRNGNAIEPNGIAQAYPYSKAFHILMHLQAVSDDDFSLEVVSYKPRPEVDISNILDNPFHPVSKGGEHD